MKGGTLIIAIRKASSFLGRLLAGCLLSNRALGGTLLHFDEAAPLLVGKNVVESQAGLAGVIMLLFAGGLSLLAVGYVLDSLRSQGLPFR